MCAESNVAEVPGPWAKWFLSFFQVVLTTAFDTTWDLITPENIAQSLGAFAAFLAIAISLSHIWRHWRFNRSNLRKSTVRLLFIIPIFALDSWACLMLEDSVHKWAELLTGIREVYEAIALVSFMELFLAILGGTQRLSQALLDDAASRDPEHPPLVHHVWPLRLFLPPYRAGPEFIRHTLLGIFQYVFGSLLYLLLVYLIWGLSWAGVLTGTAENVFRILPNLLKAASCAWALNCLFLLAHEVYEHVPPCGLPLKFLSIKGIVFFTFWQGFVISCCQITGQFSRAQQYFTEKSKEQGIDPHWWDQSQLKSGLNDFLLCFEVLFFSILHLFAYPAREIDRMPVELKAQIGVQDPPGLERLISAVNLMNISKIHQEIMSLEPDRVAEKSGNVDSGPAACTRWRKFLDPSALFAQFRARVRLHRISEPLLVSEGSRC